MQSAPPAPLEVRGVASMPTLSPLSSILMFILLLYTYAELREYMAA
jgi:hypothetical protein